jgi:hypothetical protein
MDFGTGDEEGRAEPEGGSGGDDEVDANNVPNESKRAGFTFESDELRPSDEPVPAGLTSESGDGNCREADPVAAETVIGGEEEGEIDSVLDELPGRGFSLSLVLAALR